MPAGLAAVGGTNQVVLTWTANAESDLSGYDLYRDGVKVNTIPPDRHLLHRHRSCRRHHLLLPHRAPTDTHGNASAQCAAVSATTLTPADTTPPAAPATLSAVDKPADQGGAINLSWAAATDNVGVTGYKLYRGTAAGTYGAPTTLGNVTTYTDATAATGTRYYYAVAAVDAAGNEGAKSPEADATAADNLAPAVPSGLAAVGGAGEVALSWSANAESDLAGYDLFRDGVKVNAVADHGHELHRHRSC